MTSAEWYKKYPNGPHPSCGDGWLNIIDKLTEAVVTLDPEAHIHQIKEKFGELRYYITTTAFHEAIDMLIAGAAFECDRTCEDCGKYDSLLNDTVKNAPVGGWWRTLCTDCRTANERKLGLAELIEEGIDDGAYDDILKGEQE